MRKFRPAIMPIYLALCLLLGGSSAGGFVVNMLLQILAICVISWVLFSSTSTLPSRQAAVPLAIVALITAIVAVQLVPLPPAIWSQLPGREAVAAGFELLGQPLPWLPLSLAPADTVSSFLWLLPAFALFLGILLLGAYRSAWIAGTVVAVALFGVMLGAIQLAGGSDSIAYFYDRTNRGIAVGTFANGNHFATLLLVSIPFIAALYRHLTQKAHRPASATFSMLAVAAILTLAVGIAINGSLAGIGLFIPVALASMLMLNWKWLPSLRNSATALGVITAVVAGFMLLGPVDNNLFGIDAQNSSDSRATSFALTAQGAWSFAPAGSGIGTFIEIYRTLEDPETITRFYMNNAHNDYLQIALETGIAGLLLILLGLVWYIRRTVAIWRGSEHNWFERAATIGMAAILVHSVFDYPLRTAAISATFAACAALIAQPRHKTGTRQLARGDGVHLAA